jgi:protein-L-isoaspartate(D-aspartate) O-methyltransferase
MSQMKDDQYFERQRMAMVRDQIMLRGVTDSRVLAAMRKVERHRFVPYAYQDEAYHDYPLPIGEGQTISQPYIVAFMTEALELKPDDKVLEIGTGSGYQAAILAEMGVKVYTIERQRELYRKAQVMLNSLGYRIHFFLGDGYEGQPQYGPYDGIIITAATAEVPDRLLRQLRAGGRLVAPIGDRDSQVMTLYTRLGEDEWEKTTHGHFVFVPMLKGIANGNEKE